MKNQMKKSLPYIAILVAMLIWGTTPIATKFVLLSLHPLTLVTLRFLIAVILMLCVGLLSRSLQKLQLQHLPLFLLGGFVNPFLYYILEAYGLRISASPTVSEVLLSTSPLFAPIFAFLLLREKVTVNNIIGILISTAGVILMILAGNSNFSMGSPWGIPLLFAAVMCAVLYTIVIRKAPAQYNALTVVFYVQLFSLLFFIPVWFIVDMPELSQMHFTWQPLLTVFYLAAFASVIAFVLFCFAVRRIGVTRANAFNNIRPVFTALIMLCFFSETLPWQKWLAIAIVILGLFICQYQKK